MERNIDVRWEVNMTESKETYPSSVVLMELWNTVHTSLVAERQKGILLPDAVDKLNKEKGIKVRYWGK